MKSDEIRETFDNDQQLDRSASSGTWASAHDCTSSSCPSFRSGAPATPASSRGALVRGCQPIDRFVTVDAVQAQAARELGLKV